MTIQDEDNNLVAAVESEATVEKSVETLLTQLTGIITSLKAQTVEPATVAALEQATAALQASSAAMQAAVTANTPAA
jgi:hypothetical protein